jgi:hypothetical protein
MEVLSTSLSKLPTISSEGIPVNSEKAAFECTIEWERDPSTISLLKIDLDSGLEKEVKYVSFKAIKVSRFLTLPLDCEEAHFLK